MKDVFAWLRDEESGQGMVEYGLILALIAVAVIGILIVMRGKLQNIFNAANNGLGNAASGG